MNELQQDQHFPSPYAILQVSRTATEQDIKRAYRRLALQYHPDKNLSNENAPALFKQISNASDILLDPDKRRIYDKFGYFGLNFMESSPWLTADRIDSIASLSLVLALFLIVIAIHLILVCIKTDHSAPQNSASWHLYMIPTYLMLGLYWMLNIVGVYQCRVSESSGPLVRLFQSTCLLTFFVLCLCYADSFIPFTWLITIPYYLKELESSISNFVSTFITPESADDDPPNKLELLIPYMVSLYTPTCRFMFTTFVFAKLTNSVDWNWGLVFIPLYIWPLRSLVMILYLIITTVEPDTTRRALFVKKVAPLVIGYAIFYTIIGLINYKLNGGGVYLSVVFIPIWILFLILVFVFGCVLPCILAFDLGEMDLDGLSQFVPVNRRIEFIAIP